MALECHMCHDRHILLLIITCKISYLFIYKRRNERKKKSIKENIAKLGIDVVISVRQFESLP